MFKLRRPCKSCPFKRGNGRNFGLAAARLREIFSAPAFQCHATVNYDCDDPRGRQGDKPQQCAGLMAILHRENRPNQIMQVGERFGALDLAKLDPGGEAYATIASAMRAHAANPTNRLRSRLIGELKT